MRNLIYCFLAVAFLPLVACSNDDSIGGKKAVGPSSSGSNDMPFGGPTGPEGAGALGILDQR